MFVASIVAVNRRMPAARAQATPAARSRRPIPRRREAVGDGNRDLRPARSVGLDAQVADNPRRSAGLDASDGDEPFPALVVGVAEAVRLGRRQAAACAHEARHAAVRGECLVEAPKRVRVGGADMADLDELVHGTTMVYRRRRRQVPSGPSHGTFGPG